MPTYHREGDRLKAKFCNGSSVADVGHWVEVSFHEKDGILIDPLMVRVVAVLRTANGNVESLVLQEAYTWFVYMVSAWTGVAYKTTHHPQNHKLRGTDGLPVKDFHKPTITFQLNRIEAVYKDKHGRFPVNVREIDGDYFVAVGPDKNGELAEIYVEHDKCHAFRQMYSSPEHAALAAYELNQEARERSLEKNKRSN